MSAETIARELVDGFRASSTAAINMPDHAIRQARWYQLYVRLARPTLDWVGVIGAAYALFLGHWIGRPMSLEYAIVDLGFAATLFGVRTLEKIKGVA